jgi:hypothetical protein
MGSKKKTTPGTKPLTKVARPIALKPSSSDYATYVRTTSQAMAVTGPASQKTKPNERFLSLVKSGS